MGNNGAWSIMQVTVIGLYDAGRLDPVTLDVVMGAYHGMDIDYGGHNDSLVAKDGLDLFEVAWKVHHPDKRVPKRGDTVEEFWDSLAKKHEWC